MKIATLSIGDEVVRGEIVDTNARHIARVLGLHGLHIAEHRAVGDNDLDIVDAINGLAPRNQAVIVTGGLGPTVDDVTMRAAAKATSRRLVLYDDALNHLQAFASKGTTTVVEANEKQALFPAKSVLIPNPMGTACGFYLVHNECTLFFLPGVPQEMEPMLNQGVIPILKERLPRDKAHAIHTFRIFGLSEVQLDRLLKDLHLPEEGISVALCAQFPEIEVKLRGEGKDSRIVMERLAKAGDAVRERLQDCIFAEETSASMPEVVATLFRNRNQTLALAESCTGGQIAKVITDIAGSSSFFLEGAVTYSNEAKIRALNVPVKILRDHGAVSSQVATAMADGIRSAACADVALAVTGIAGPGGGSDEKPVGTVYMALATGSATAARHYRFSGDRERIRTMTTYVALDWLRRHLLSLH